MSGLGTTADFYRNYRVHSDHMCDVIYISDRIWTTVFEPGIVTPEPWFVTQILLCVRLRMVTF